MLSLSRALNGKSNILHELFPIICDYALGHDLVKPRTPEGNAETMVGTVITFDALEDAVREKRIDPFQVCEYKWLKQEQEIKAVETIIYHGKYADTDILLAPVKGRGTILQLSVSMPDGEMGLQKIYVVNDLEESDEVRVALFLYEYATPTLRICICPVYTDALRFM